MVKIKLNDRVVIISGDANEKRMIKSSQTYNDTSKCMTSNGFDSRKAKKVSLLKEIKSEKAKKELGVNETFLVGFPGLIREILIFCKNNNIKIKFTDERTHFDFQDKEWTYEELRGFFDPKFKYVDHQIRTLQAMLKTNKAILKLPTSAGKCCCGNTKIILEGSFKPIKIKSLFKYIDEEEAIDTSFLNINILTEDGFNKINALYKTNKRKILKLKLDNGDKIKAVPEHRVLTKDGWKFLKDLKEGDLVLCLKKKKKKKRDILKNIFHSLTPLKIFVIKLVEAIIKILSK